MTLCSVLLRDSQMVGFVSHRSRVNTEGLVWPSAVAVLWAVFWDCFCPVVVLSNGCELHQDEKSSVIQPLEHKAGRATREAVLCLCLSFSESFGDTYLSIPF